MSALVLLLLAVGCPPDAVSHVPETKRDLACQVLARDAPREVDRAALDAIYRQPQMSRARIRTTGTLESTLARLEAWLDHLAGSRGVETYSVVTRWVVMGLGAVVALWAIARLMDRRKRRGAVAAGPGSVAPVLEDPQVHFARAEAAVVERPREALREALLGLISSLERARLARPDRVKTNRELVKELPTRGAGAELTREVGAAMGWYDEAFYSLAPVATEEARRFLGEARRVGTLAAPGVAP